MKVVKPNYFRELYVWMAVPFIGFFIGWKLDKMEDERLSRFRDKSKLYAREVPPAEPSW